MLFIAPYISETSVKVKGTAMTDVSDIYGKVIIHFTHTLLEELLTCPIAKARDFTGLCDQGQNNV